MYLNVDGSDPMSNTGGLECLFLIEQAREDPLLDIEVSTDILRISIQNIAGFECVQYKHK